MTKRYEVYKCDICGNIVLVLDPGAGELVCCGQPMQLQAEKTNDQGQEKHVPVIEKNEKCVKVKVGSVAHPMEDSHYIEWIELTADGKVYMKFLQPGELPEAEFCIQGEQLSAREYCSIHGLWKTK